MAAPREDPDVSFQVRQKLDIDLRLVALHVVTQRGHRIGRRELRPHVAQRIARARSHDAEIRVHLAAGRLQPPARALPLHARHARLLDLRARPLGPLQQHVVQVESRIDHQRIAQLERHFAGLRRRQHALRDHPLRRGIVNQERVLAVRLVRQPAAARLFPGELFVHQDHAESGRCQFLRGVCSRRTATQDCDTLHFFLPAGGRSSGAGILPPAPGAAIDPPP